LPMTEQRLGGVCAATLTPFDSAGAPDCTALIAHCRRLLGNGCDAINLLGTTGEATSLSVRERLDVMEAVAASGLPLERFMVGTGAAAYADALTLTRAATALGFAGALIIPPFYFKNLTDDGVLRYYDRLVAHAGDGLRLYLYNFPQLSGFAFSPLLVLRLATAFGPVMQGIKDSSGSADYAESVVAACPSIDVFPSSESGLSEAKAKGFAGCISATVNVSAPLAGRVWSGDGERQRALTAIRTSFAKHQLVPALRAVMSSLLADPAWLRMQPPLIELAEPAAARLIAELDMIPDFAGIRETFACA
jgi:4-hydroxy-tetrahydrodipicolinate synthase